MGDWVDREYVLAAFNTGINNLVVGGKENANRVERYLNRVLDKIKDLPSVQLSADCISRQQAIDAVKKLSLGETDATRLAMRIGDYLERLPSAQPEIIRCRECKFASGDSRICMKFDHSPIGELDFCSFAERREVNNESD